MMNPIALTCQNERRRHKIREKKESFNGLDYLEVVDAESIDDLLLSKATRGHSGLELDTRHVFLRVFFLNKAPQEPLRVSNVVIKGGRRIRDIQVLRVTMCRQLREDLDECMVVEVDKSGDFSNYTLCVVKDENGRPTDEVLPGFDPRYACLEFNFKVNCPSDLDCAQAPMCPPPIYPAPEINYLAKDYASFRQLILDRLALTMPDWQKRHVPDLGITLVELLAYAGDYLSYYQDAVATEAYLDTARQRISVRRHARLVDYQMHEGCNARAWVHVNADTDVSLQPDSIAFIAGYNKVLAAGRVLAWTDLGNVPADQFEVFEPLTRTEIHLYAAHNEMRFYTWGDRECCLPRGATAATLADVWVEEETEQSEPIAEQSSGQKRGRAKRSSSANRHERERVLRHLQAGDVLVFEEVKGPQTGLGADADPVHRHVVRLIQVKPTIDPLYDQPIVEIEWADADALPFPLCISAVGPAPHCALLEDISVARGNMVLVDHGRRIKDESLGCVEAQETTVTCEGEGRPSSSQKAPLPFRPVLQKAPIAFSQPAPGGQPASAMLIQDPRRALPWIRVTSVFETQGGVDQGGTALPPVDWMARRDLLDSGAQDPHFVVEIDNVGKAHLRFGDGELGRLPAAGLAFTTTYRVGNGLAGNVGAGAISHVVSTELLSGVSLEPRNPLPACGGIEPEPVDEVRLFAPHAFRRRLERAVTAEDYAVIVMRDFADSVQRAAATLRWTGSWTEVLVAVDPMGKPEPAQALLDAIGRHLDAYRRAGHDVVVKAAEYVPLDIVMHVCAQPNYLRGHVQAALTALFSNRALPDGRLGFFHPDNLTFGEGVYVSKLVAAAQAVPGVGSVSIEKLQRLGEGANGELTQGVLPLGPLEIARVDNDPSFPENGRIRLNMGGGR